MSESKTVTRYFFDQKSKLDKRVSYGHLMPTFDDEIGDINTDVKAFEWAKECMLHLTHIEIINIQCQTTSIRPAIESASSIECIEPRADMSKYVPFTDPHTGETLYRYVP